MSAADVEAGFDPAAGAPRPGHGAHGAEVLSLRAVVKKFGALVALNDLSFDVLPGEIFGVAGPNGAGKSTLLNVCTGVLSPDAGEIVFAGEPMQGRPPHRFCRKGIARTFQIPQIFVSMSVFDNVATGAMFGLAGKPAEDRPVKEHVDAILEMTGLAPKREMPARHADLLTRKMTMLAAALATSPTLVFMDEPLAGFTTQETDRFSALISRIHQDLAITFVVVEHKIRALTKLADRIMILHQGARICLDTPQNVLRDKRVIDVYLGSRPND